MTEDEELSLLRKENALLRVERDILLRVASGYARDHQLLVREAREDGDTP
jgi:hypothetical protein